MKAIVTGANGTVGSALVQALKAKKHTVIPWDRSAVPIDNYAAMEDFVRQSGADIVYHLAIASRPTGVANEAGLVNHHWPSELAWITRHLGLRFVFTSTVMVWSEKTKGPFTPTTAPDSGSGYGEERHRIEERIFHQNPLSTVVRLGWQIAETPGGNHMVDYLDRMQKSQGVIRASSKWLPACSYLEDTADGLLQLAEMDCGLYLLDSNAGGWSFHEIACALRDKQRFDWDIRETTEFVQDQRMIDPRMKVASLNKRLPTLPKRRSKKNP